MSETRGQKSFQYMYDANGEVVSVTYQENPTLPKYTYFYVRNQLGDVIELYFTGGQKIATYEYDAWGKVIGVKDVNGNAITASTHIANLNPIRYRGYYYDNETGLYYLQSRYYDPATCRFINADGLFDTGRQFGQNMYSYCENNPIMNVDPTGQCDCPYDGTAGDFRRLDHNLPPANCKCNNTSNSAMASSKTGTPNSKETDYNSDGTPKQDRFYGPDGKRTKDRDYNHPGDHDFPHEHDWSWDGDDATRGPARPPVIVAVLGVLLYAVAGVSTGGTTSYASFVFTPDLSTSPDPNSVIWDENMIPY